MVIEFNNLSKSNLIVNEIYKGGIQPGKGSEVLSKLIPGISNSGGFRIKNNGHSDLLGILYADNKHPEWVNIFDSETGGFVYYGDNKEPGVSVKDSNKRGMKFLNRVNEKLKNGNRRKIPPILVFVKAGQGWDVRFIGLAVPGVLQNGNKQIFLEEVSYQQDDGAVFNYRSSYTILNINVISREWLADILIGKIYTSEHVSEVWKRWVDNNEYNPLINVVDSFGLEQLKPVQKELVKEQVNIVEVKDVVIIPHIQKYITSKGFNYSLANIKNLYLSLRSKPFVIISGISGTGKSKIVQLFAESIGATEDNGQFTLIPVRPDWSDGSELLGYTDIKGDFKEGPLAKAVREASNNPDRPYFVLLDEMNLARVEYYFSDILSIMESRKKDGDTYISSTLIEIEDEKLTLPNNLYIIGTVNMDETTHPFSKKVLDRANTIEFNEIHLANFSFLTNKEAVESIQLANSSIEASYVQLKDCYEKNEEIIRHVSNELTTINKIIEPLNAHVGYRVRDEICFYMIYNNEGSLFEKDVAFDYCLMQKILPRIAGSGLKIRTVLVQLFEHFTEHNYIDDETFDITAVRYPLSAKKVHDMLGRLGDEGFTSFWIS